MIVQALTDDGNARANARDTDTARLLLPD